ncbi:cobalt-precorrin-7 (C(5))-methyltransferase [Sporanaerobium hydrogeniformans]|uniref:Cobalt-precorrin-7 (C(5))-methyltransferase n=1 Tax=Sporanaerobium hydrogeniformans TaxID=3072179 RepID=A0AC61DE22_9FIRM|nr:cobalt-precorrin-7 (C(5))-methyltransferase [Sporanaerobium hydrogeniformans]PHV70991.1 cobalt-precorrin-7 (C(5))-methyltransferase [Sporanaerobium hydrogeniformans]
MIHVIGMGPGEGGYITELGNQLLEKADLIIGATRHLEAVPPQCKGLKRALDRKLEELTLFLKGNLEKEVVVLASGDPLIYGIGKYLSEQLPKEYLHIVSGISSIQYFFSRLQMDMNDLYITSTHGKVPHFDQLLSFEKVALVTDQHIGPYEIAQEILKRSLKKTLWIGENLSYGDEVISCLKPEEIEKERIFKRNVVVILDEK